MAEIAGGKTRRREKEGGVGVGIGRVPTEVLAKHTRCSLPPPCTRAEKAHKTSTDSGRLHVVGFLVHPLLRKASYPKP